MTMVMMVMMMAVMKMMVMMLFFALVMCFDDPCFTAFYCLFLTCRIQMHMKMQSNFEADYNVIRVPERILHNEKSQKV